MSITAKGVVYVSAQNWTPDTKVGDGGVWVCNGTGTAVQLARLGRTNGIELSPDDKYLYVSEAFNVGGSPVKNVILRYTLRPDGGLGPRKVFHDFQPDGTARIDIDGMRTDVQGNLYVTRNGGSGVAVFSPDGSRRSFIQTGFTFPTNVELGGRDGRTLYAVGRCGINTPYGRGNGCTQAFPGMRYPGRYWSMLKRKLPSLP